MKPTIRCTNCGKEFVDETELVHMHDDTEPDPHNENWMDACPVCKTDKDLLDLPGEAMQIVNVNLMEQPASIGFVSPPFEYQNSEEIGPALDKLWLAGEREGVVGSRAGSPHPRH